jgi:hypothetical protein
MHAWQTITEAQYHQITNASMPRVRRQIALIAIAPLVAMQFSCYM